MATIFYSPCGESWEPTPIFTDRANIISTRVRRYFYKNIIFTVLACMDYNYPYYIFYNLEIARPQGVEFPTSSHEDIQILHRMMNECPVPAANYYKCETKLYSKVDKLRRTDMEQKMVKFMHGNMQKTNKYMYIETGDVFDAADRAAIKGYNSANKRCRIAIDDDDYDSGLFGNMLRVFARSGIHGNYAGKGDFKINKMRILKN